MGGGRSEPDRINFVIKTWLSVCGAGNTFASSCGNAPIQVELLQRDDMLHGSSS